MSDEYDRLYALMPRAPARLSPGQPGELLFEFYVERTKKFYRCELRDHGPEYGVEAQFFDPVDLIFARRFDPRLDASRPSRELAIAWAHEERAALEQPEAVALEALQVKVPSGERLYEFAVGDDWYRVELRDDGHAFGVECQLLKNDAFWCSRRFAPRAGETRPFGELAIAWAEDERKALQRGGE